MSLALLLLAAAAAATGASPPPALVWSGATAALNLSVFSDDSYTISLDGVPAFVSGVFALRVNSSWYVSLGGGAGPPPSATCTSNLTDTDCRGNDMYYFNTTSAAQCCANCSANPACGAWTYTGETAAAAAAAAPPYWAQRCYIKSACDASHYAGHTSGTQGGGSAALPLARLGAGPLAGQHATLGAYTGWEVRYAAGATPVSSAFLFFPAGQGLFLFNTSFPQGAEGVAALTPGGGGGGGEFSASQQPSTQFPVLAPAPAAAPLGAVTWQGRFFSEAGAGSLGGAEGGPLAYFRSGAGSGSAPTLVLAPYTLFKSTHAGAPLAGQALPGTLALGLNAYVPALPPGFALSVSLTGSLAGVNAAVHAWGEALLASRGTVRAADPSSQALTYWTAYYDFYAYEPDINSAGVPATILAELYQTFTNGTYDPPLPVKMIMLDAWWMYNVRANGNCKVNDTAWPLPLPGGLTGLSASLGGTPLIIYNGPQCGNSTYGSAWPLEQSLYWDQGWGSGVLSAIAANSSLAFYRQLFASLKVQGMGSFTQDFLDFQSLLFPGFLRDPEGNAGWLRGQAQAAAEAGVAVQYCMALPADILASVDFPAVTNARASQDYGAGGQNWRIQGSSLLLSALRLRASKDNFWSGPRNDRGWESSPFLVAAVAALSAGPVGFADPLHGTNPAVLWPAMTRNGTLLHPSRPATYIDAQWTATGPLAGLQVSAAHCALGGSGLRAYSLLAPTAGASAAVMAGLALGDLWPAPAAVAGLTPPSAPPRLLLWAYNASGCTAGGAAGACVVELGSGAPPPPPPPPSGDAQPWAIINASPLLANGYALLGEVDKYVAASPDRVREVGLGAGGAGLRVALAGAPNEALRVAFYRPGASAQVVVAALALDASGGLITTLV